MYEIEVERQDRKDPTVDAGARTEVWVSEHAFDVTSVYFDYEVPYTDEIQLERSKCSKEPV
jgi:hypothetical protein